MLKKSTLVITTVVALLVASVVFLPLVVSAENQPIPSWIKGVAGFWSSNKISDNEFVNAMEFLINSGTIKVTKNSLVSPDVDKLTVGFIPTEKAEELTPKASELEKYLEKELGIDVAVVVPSDYEILIEGMRFGHIDAAFMDTGPAWIAHKKMGAEVVLAEVVKGQVSYQATVWARADDNSIKTLDDTLGKRVAFTSITGSSGFVKPIGTLVKEGKIKVNGNDIVALESALANSFKSYTFTGGYKAALELLLNNNVDVAFGSDIAAQQYLEPADQAKLRIVEKIGPIPSHVFMVSSDMSEATRNSLVDAMVKLNYEENNQILKNIYGAESLLPTTTKMHIGDFGTYIDALTGLDKKFVEKST